MKSNGDGIKNEAKKIVAQVTGLVEEKLTDDAKFTSDLGVDSMVALEIVAAIEKKYRVVIPEEEIPKTQSMGDIYKLLDKLL
jgi:acyl carrier protein